MLEQELSAAAQLAKVIRLRATRQQGHRLPTAGISGGGVEEEEEEEERRIKSNQIKKALLKAQRDYHPDRNAGQVRSTLALELPEEWEVLCKAICQQLAIAYDRLYKPVHEV